MQVNPSFRPPNRAYTDMSPASTAGSEWSGMNHYHNPPLRPGGSFGVPPRGDSMSPPDSSGSMGGPYYGGNGHDSQYSSYDLHAPLQPPGPRSGSRASSRAGSMAYSISSDGTIGDQQSRKYQRMEAELRQHYAVLRAYLRGNSAQGMPKNRARDKLLRLSPVQFHELSTDVFDELQRRQAAAPLPGRPPRGKVPPFLPARMDFHEKRNQARQKLSSLPTSRFRDLSTDVFFELERRFPNFNPEGRPESVRSRSRGPRGYSSSQNSFAPPPRSHTVNGSMSAGPNGFSRRQESVNYFSNGASIDHGRPMQQQFQSNTITPNKSTMVEDEEDDDGGPISHYARSSDAFGLESVLTSPGSGRDTSATSLTGESHDVKGGPSTTEFQEQILDLETKLQAKDDEIRELSTMKQLKQDLEIKVEDAEKLNKSLQEDLDRLQSDHANMERDLRSQLSTAKSAADNGEWRNKHEELDREHQNLRSKYEGQLRTTEEVSKQFKIHLADMRAMAEDSGNSLKREEKLHQEIQRLADEIKDWKSRYTKAKTQLRTARQSTMGLGLSRPEMSPNFHAPDGLVKDINVTRFQLAIDELLKAARSERPVTVLDHMKTVVVAVGGVTADAESAATEDKDEEASKRRAKLKSKVSVTANNVITASKNFAAADGLSPVSLLDAAASHLTSAMVDLLRNVKIRPTPPGELEVNDEPAPGIVNEAGYFPVTETLRRRSAADSVYSAVSDPPNDHTKQQQSSSQDHLATQTHMNGYGGSPGLGINPMQGLRADETELEELKVYLGNQTDLLVQSVQGLVASVRGEDDMAMIRHHISNIVDIVENVVGASEGAMEDISSFQTSLTESISSTVDVIKGCRDKLEHMAIESQRHDGEPSAKQFSQGLPPLAFQIARELKELVSRTEGVEVGLPPGDEDFS